MEAYEHGSHVHGVDTPIPEAGSLALRETTGLYSHPHLAAYAILKVPLRFLSQTHYKVCCKTMAAKRSETIDSLPQLNVGICRTARSTGTRTFLVSSYSC